jgi:hypothetical protein
MRLPHILKIAISAGLLPMLAAAAHAAPSASIAPKFYPGIRETQSMRAHEALRVFYNGNLARAEGLLREMDAQEDRDSLPPLSRLLLTAMTGLTIQRDDAGSPEEAARLRAALDSAAEKGLRKCAERAKPARDAGGSKASDKKTNPGDPTCLLIEGGIRGFRAILDLNTRTPMEVLDEGLSAVKLLEKALALDSNVRDAHLGLGIFNATAASSSPRVGRAVLRAVGRGVSLDAGLAHLRRSGYEGQYTSVASQFYLIFFLSPYDDELRREKSEILRSLRATFPLAPHTLFLQGHEALCFYPDSFYRPRARVNLARRLRAVEARDYAGRRYLNLARHQYTLLDADPPGQYAPDTAFDLRGYAFYPGFIAALRLRRDILAMDPGAPERAEQLKRLSGMRKKLLAQIQKADLNPQNRGLYAWHVRDALRPELFGPAAAQEAADSTASTSKAAGKSRRPPER